MTAIKFSKEKPPNWERLIRGFPHAEALWRQGVIVTWGDTYYSIVETTPDLVAHEEVHMRQQELVGGPENWWNRYYVDIAFRLEQELEAYRAQFKYLEDHKEDRSRQQRREETRRMAKNLSSPLYGNIIGYDKALELIKQ